jgi:hypothetical protein
MSTQRAIRVRTVGAALSCAVLIGGCAAGTEQPTTVPETTSSGSHDRSEVPVRNLSRPAWTPPDPPPSAPDPSVAPDPGTDADRDEQRLGIRDTVTVEIDG